MNKNIDFYIKNQCTIEQLTTIVHLESWFYILFYELKKKIGENKLKNKYQNNIHRHRHQT